MDVVFQIKQEALTVAEMQAFVQKRAEEEEKLKMEIEEVIDAIQKYVYVYLYLL